MFILRSKTTQKPEKYPAVERVIPTKANNFEGWDKVGDHVLRDGVDIIPNPMMQEPFLASDADIKIAMGAISMGKTYALGLQFLDRIEKQGYTGYLFSKKLIDSTQGGSMLRDMRQIVGDFADCNVTTSDYPTFMFPTWKSSVQMLHANFNIATKTGWKEFEEFAKKRQGSDIAIDEATDWEFKAVMYLLTRGRDSSGCRTRLSLTGNPDHEHWTTAFLMAGGYLDEEWLLIPEMLERKRYVRINATPETCIFGDTPEEVVVKDPTLHITQEMLRDGYQIEDLVKSISVFSGNILANSKVAKNTKGQNIVNTFHIGGADGRRLRDGYFGPIDQSEVHVSNDQILRMFTMDGTRTGEKFASMDVSGGEDNTVMMIWDGLDIMACEHFQSKDPVMIRQWAKNMLEKYDVHESHLVFDANGLGFFMTELTQAIPIHGQARALSADALGNPITGESYMNLRSQLLGKLEALIKMGEISCSVSSVERFPHNKGKEMLLLKDILKEEKEVFRKFENRNGKIQYNSKKEFNARYRYSPDYMDAIMYRIYFELNPKPRKEAPKQYTAEDYYRGLNTKRKSPWKRR